jgi:hypothetical protein
MSALHQAKVWESADTLRLPPQTQPHCRNKLKEPMSGGNGAYCMQAFPTLPRGSAKLDYGNSDPAAQHGNMMSVAVGIVRR